MSVCYYSHGVKHTNVTGVIRFYHWDNDLDYTQWIFCLDSLGQLAVPIAACLPIMCSETYDLLQGSWL